MLHFYHKFRKNSTNKKKHSSLFINLLYLEIIVLIHIGLEKLNPSYNKIPFNKKY